MKEKLSITLVILSVMFMSFIWTNQPTNVDDVAESVDKKVEVIYTFENGETQTHLTTLDALDEIPTLSEEKLLACTYQFEGGECTTTASTCAAAQAGFEACACQLGHDHFCPEAESPDSGFDDGDIGG